MYFCRDQSFVATDTCLSGETCVLSRQNTSFVGATVCLSFVATKIFRRDITVVEKNICRDKHNFVMTNVLSRQAYFCRDKRRVLCL